MFLEVLLFLLFVISVSILLIVIPIDYVDLRPSLVWKMSKLPGPRAVPLFGLVLEVASLTETNVIAFLWKYRQAYPRLWAFWIAGLPKVVIHEPDDIEAILGSPIHIEKGREYKVLIPWLQDGLLLSTGAKWHQRRKLLTPAFHFNILEDSLQHLNKNAKKLLLNMLKKEGEPLIAKDIIEPCTLDIICETSMGYSLNLLDNSEANSHYLKAVQSVSVLALRRMLRLYLNKEWLYRRSKDGKTYYKHLNYLHGFTEKIIAQRKQDFEKSKVEQKLNNIKEEEFSDKDEEFKVKKKKVFLDILIELDRKYGNLFSDKDIREEVDTFMFEGFDTTSAAIVHALYLLGRHPDIQEKAYRELNDVFGESDRPATSKDLHEMHYLEMVIKETLRLYPSVPYISRRVNEDIELKGNLVLPEGVNTTIIPYVLHRDSRYYPNPEVFDPERFNLENCKKRHPYAYLPFSAGPRNCIGQKFAMMELKVILSTILRFTKIQSLNEIDESVLSPLILLRSIVPIQIKVTRRI